MSERMIHVGGVELCTEPFGDRADAPILLVMGLGASMLWWPDDFCQALASSGRFVVRYDHRDTGRSTTYPAGKPRYTEGDLLSDAVGVLDAYELPCAHVVGVSAGGALAQLLALDHPDRVLSLVVVSTSPASAVGRELPAPREEFGRFFAEHRVDWSDRASVVDYLVSYTMMLAGGERRLDEAALRAFVSRDVERANDFAATRNHDALAEDRRERAPLSAIDVPTLVIHGTADPLFPIEHGRALAETIRKARLVAIEGAGHGLESMDTRMLADAIVEHTRSGDDPARAHP